MGIAPQTIPIPKWGIFLTTLANSIAQRQKPSRIWWPKPTLTVPQASGSIFDADQLKLLSGITNLQSKVDCEVTIASVFSSVCASKLWINRSHVEVSYAQGIFSCEKLICLFIFVVNNFSIVSMSIKNVNGFVGGSFHSWHALIVLNIFNNIKCLVCTLASERTHLAKKFRRRYKLKKHSI